MKIISFVGTSDSGKTFLLTRLIAECVKRGIRVAVLKHCAHGFDLDSPGKDSWKLTEAGAEGVAMVSYEGWALFQKSTVDAEDNLKTLAGKFFPHVDLVFVEGGKRQVGLKKIEVLGEGSNSSPQTPPHQLIAVVTKDERNKDFSVPLFSFSRIGEICDFILSQGEDIMTEIKLEVDGKEILLNPFVRTFIANTVRGMVTSLDGVGSEPKSISLVMESEAPGASHE